MSRLVQTLVCIGALAAVSTAQDLLLDVRGGSMPGVLDVHCRPGLYPFEPMFVLPSTTTGPTPCSLLNPFDFRQLDVGLDLLSAAWIALSDANGDLQFQVPLGTVPSAVDLPLYVQAITIYPSPLTVDRISNSTAVRLGLAGAFRDRGVTFLGPRAFATVLPRADRRWMVVGGAQGTLLAQVATYTSAVYDPMTDTFSPGPSLNSPRSMHSCTPLPDGTWLIAGGVDYNNDPQATCERYDPLTDTFTPINSMNVARMGHTATVLANGKVLVTGGIQAMPTSPTQLQPIRETVASSELFDPVTGTWTLGPSMATPRVGHMAISRPDGKVLLAGGISWDFNIVVGWLPAVRRSCDLYDPVANTMGPAPQMANARSLIDAVDLGNGRWLAAGGIAGITIIPWNPGNPTATAEVYDAVANTWTTVGPMGTARGNHRGWARGDGTFLLAGGANGSVLSPTPLASTEVFSPLTNTFSPGPAMTSPRAGAAAFATPIGQMQLFGGASSGGSIANSTEWYFF